MLNLLSAILLIIILGCLIIQLKKQENFKANSNIPLPSINFNYLSDPNYSQRALNKYYYNDDYTWILGRRKIGFIPHEYKYKHTIDGNTYYYGDKYRNIAYQERLAKIRR
jgi:hypothetical protein